MENIIDPDLIELAAAGNEDDFQQLLGGARTCLKRREEEKKKDLSAAQKVVLGAGAATILGGTALLLHPSMGETSYAATAEAPTLVPNPTAENPATPTLAPTAPATPEVKTYSGDLLKDVFAPAFYEEALRIRQERQRNDPEWSKRVDVQLNKNRFNLLVLGVGSEVDAQYTDTIMVASYSLIDNSIQLVSLERDLYAPEVDRYKKEHGIDRPDYNAINTAFSIGGKELVEKTIEDATGLSVDFITKFGFDDLAQLVDEVFGEVEIDAEEIDDRPAGYDVYFAKGIQKMNGKLLQLYLRSRKSTSEVARNNRQQETILRLVDIFIARFKGGEISIVPKALQSFKGLNSSSRGTFSTDIDIDNIVQKKKGGFLGGVLDLGNSFLQSLKKGQIIPSLSRPPVKTFVPQPMEGIIDWLRDKKVVDIRPSTLGVVGGDKDAADLARGYWGLLRDKIKAIILDNA